MIVKCLKRENRNGTSIYTLETQDESVFEMKSYELKEQIKKKENIC